MLLPADRSQLPSADPATPRRPRNGWRPAAGWRSSGDWSRRPALRRWAIFAAALLALVCEQEGFAQAAARVEPIHRLDRFVVKSSEQDYDVTGMGTVEEQMREEPFANDLINVSDFAVDSEDVEMDALVAAAAQSSPAQRIAGDERLNLRGFPTPALRDSFIQVGIPETLNTAQTIIIQGPLVPVLGRAAPGGIQNSMTARPRANEQTRSSGSASSDGVRRAGFEYTSPVAKKKTWQRVALEWQLRTGPEQFAREETWSSNASLSWRHSRAASTLFSIDLRQVEGTVSPGIPEYRLDATQLIAGPYRPLARFNANGPAAATRRSSVVAGVQFDGQPTKSVAVRASVQGWWREVQQDRFTQSVLNLAEGVFEGVREPRHLEQPQNAVALQLESTLRFRAVGAEQKLMASVSATRGRYQREDRSLTLAARDALPLDVRRFNPAAPNYAWPSFEPMLYGRINTDREERARYSSAELGDRLAWRNGQSVLTVGLRYDEVDMEVEDRKPGALFAWTRDRTRQISYHAGWNYQLARNRLLAFATTSTAFDPSTPVDARTGRIQDNETTVGSEAGLRARAMAGRIELSTAGFLLYNQHIARRNPLYNDPLVDAAQTQPQLIAAGEERFAGGRLELKWSPAKTVVMSLKSTCTQAITTASPDLPQEVGRPITRLPSYTVSATVRHRPLAKLNGFGWGAGWQYLDGYVANYADSRRAFLEYPGYGLCTLSAGYQWRWPQQQFDLDAGLRNVFDRDLLASNARNGAGREVTVTARLVF